MPYILLGREMAELNVNLQELFVLHVGMILVYHALHTKKCLKQVNYPSIKEITLVL